MNDTTLVTGKKYIKDIFASDQFYNIPEYQRPYVWGDEQISALLDDISKAMETDEKKEYFLGCMIWNTRKERDSNGLEYEYQDILDGQQRFITLLLLHSVIRDLSKEDLLKQSVQKKLVQEADIYDNIPARNRIEFEIRDDKDFLDAYVVNVNEANKLIDLANIAEDVKNGSSVRNMAGGILFIHKWWVAKLEETKETNINYLSKFYHYLSNKVLALYLATPNNLDDAYNLFTVLNSRGLQLQVSDILRAQNLRVIENPLKRKMYAQKWAEFENSIGAPFRNFDDFLWSLVYIKMKYKSDDNKSLTRAFEFMFKRGILSKGTQTLDFVEKYITHYQALTSGSITSKESQLLFPNIIHILSSVLGSQYMTPLLHYRECFGDNRIIDFIIKLDNLLSSSWLLGKRQSTTRIFIILRRIDQYAEKITNEGLTQEICADMFLSDPVLRYDFYDEELSSDKPISLDDFFTTLDKEKWGSFAGTRVNKSRYLLLKLDLLMGNAGTQLQYNKDSSSIEHLMPQNVVGTSWNVDDIEHKEWVHRLGNIVIVDRNKNASLSNGSFASKKIKYQGAIETRANTNFVFINYSEWNMNNIYHNHYRVVNLLKQYYSGNSLSTFLEIKRGQFKNQATLTF